MKQLNKREVFLFIFTAIVAVGSLGYVYVLEPYFKTPRRSHSSMTRYNAYLSLLDRKEEIEKKGKELFPENYCKAKPEEQQIALQMHLETIVRSSGAQQLMSIYPLPSEDKGQYKVLFFQMEVKCSITSLTRLLTYVEHSRIPLQIQQLQIYSDTGDSGLMKLHIELSSPWFPS